MWVLERANVFGVVKQTIEYDWMSDTALPLGFRLRMALTASVLSSIYLALGSGLLYLGVPLPVVVVGGIGGFGLQFWIGKRLVLRRAGAKPLPDGPEYDWLYEMRDDLAAEMEIEPPRLMQAELGGPNAFAIGRPGKGTVVLSPRLAQVLPPQGVKAVMAHEFAHLRNRDSILMTAAQSLSSAVGLVVEWVLLFLYRKRVRQGSFAAGGAIISQGLIAVLVFALSRHREYIADATAADALGSGEPLAAALLQVAQAEQETKAQDMATLCIIGLDSSLYASHPPIKKRIDRLLEDGEVTEQEAMR